MNRISLTIVLCLLAAVNVCGQCRYCNSYKDFLEDKWEHLDTVYCKNQSKGHQIMWGVSNYKLETGDEYTDRLLNTAFAVMQADTLYVNCRNLRFEKSSLGKGYCKAARIGEHSLLLVGKLAGKEAKNEMSAGATATVFAAALVGGFAGGAIVGGIIGAVSANKQLKNKVCYIVTSAADEKGHFNVKRFEDQMMDKLLLSRDLIDLHNAYYSEKDKSKRRLASRILPILEKAGIIEL